MLANKVKCPICGKHVRIAAAEALRLGCPDCGASFEHAGATMKQRPGAPAILQSKPYAPPNATMPAVAPTLPPQMPPIRELTPPPPLPATQMVPRPVKPTLPPMPPPLPVAPKGRSGLWWVAGVIGLFLVGAVGLVLHEAWAQIKATPTTATATEQVQLPTKRDDDPPQPGPLPPPPRELTEEERQVNEAIDKGVAFLRKRYNNGTFYPSNHALGLAALPAMTLLECGVPADDMQVQGAARFVRQHCVLFTGTYELVLCILFLDRLADPQDEALIVRLSLRLLAGQTLGGGWTYNCPLIDEKDDAALDAAIRNKPTLAWTEAAFGSKKPDRPGKTKDKTPLPPSKSPDNGVPERLKQLPILQDVTSDQPAPAHDPSDNSNTQFGILGVWAARRHGVPVDRSLALIDRRFRASQAKGGGWGYNYNTQHTSDASPAMTCAGLLGLAVGYGRQQQDADKPAVQNIDQDEALKAGLGELAKQIPAPAPKGTRPGGACNVYFLWSVERVGVLFGLKDIGDRDWYAWGSQMLVSRQGKDGSWHSEGHSGGPVCDTALALLFLKRVNLLSDLPTKFKVK